MQTYDTSELEQLTYLTCGDDVRQQFETWIGGMTMDRDGECGPDRVEGEETIPGYLTWIRDHNQSADFFPGGMFQTFFWRNTRTGEIVATGTIAPDDRGVKEQYELGGDGLWGGVNVRFDLRGRGLGKFACARIDEHIRSFAATEGKSKLFHLFTANPVAEHIYETLGFERNPLGEINTAAFGDERLWSKTYTLIAA
jgi:GNAT superfamily N-acetyltransferase